MRKEGSGHLLEWRKKEKKRGREERERKGGREEERKEREKGRKKRAREKERKKKGGREGGGRKERAREKERKKRKEGRKEGGKPTQSQLPEKRMGKVKREAETLFEPRFSRDTQSLVAKTRRIFRDDVGLIKSIALGPDINRLSPEGRRRKTSEGK
ncbi:Pxr1, partial [Ophiophagus hannah]